MIKINSHSTNFGLFERTFVAPCQVTTFSSTKAWIHMGGYGQLISKERKLANNSTISFIFNFWSHDMVQAQDNLNIYFWGKKTFCSRSPSERYCQSFVCSEHTFDPGLKPLAQAFTGYQPCRTVLVCPEAS